MKYNLKVIISIGVLIVGIALYFLFFKTSEQIHYITVPVNKGNINQEVSATGEVAPIQLVTIGSQVSGQIETLYVKLGQTIKKGDLIAQIDSTTQQNTYDTEQAKLDSYQAQYDAAEVQLTVAKSQYDREVTLYAQKAASKASLEEAQSTYATAKSNVVELKSLISQTQISLNTAKVNLGYTKILSTLDGTVVSVPVEEGQTVNAAMSTPTIVQIADLTEMKILMEISEGDINKIAPGMTVTYSVLSSPDDIFTTKLKAIDPGLTTLTNGSYVQGGSSDAAIYYYGRLEVPNSEGKLRIGMTTQDTIKIAYQENVLTIPMATLSEHDGKTYVRILENNNKVSEKQITTGLSDGLNIEVTSGLNEGELVIQSQMSDQEINSSVGAMQRPGRMM
ncbi:efflux RND transporter periplasmic adaptor subunit [Orbus sturtevantii]|uniref:efflux RND transporter periplasmic adaptor subunit n=1 Tax=Orbus sturtevantii TaxID=3074109 RepID=UPI00370DB1DB